MDRLSLSGLRVDCIVGVYPRERSTPQPVELDLVLQLDLRRAARDGSIKGTVDYARLAGELRFILQSARFYLLESAVEAIAAYLLAPPFGDTTHPPVEAVDVRLSKPKALAGAAVPALAVLRRAKDFTYAVDERPYGRLETLFATPECGIYRERLRPGIKTPLRALERTDEAVLVLSDEIRIQGHAARAGEARQWPRGLRHYYENTGTAEQALVRINRPALEAGDEKSVNGSLQGLMDVAPMHFFELPPAGGA